MYFGAFATIFMVVTSLILSFTRILASLQPAAACASTNDTTSLSIVCVLCAWT